MTSGWSSGATITRRFAMRRGSTPETTTGSAGTRRPYARRLLVAPAVRDCDPILGDLAREPAAVPGLLREFPLPRRAQGKGLFGVSPWALSSGTTLQSIMSRHTLSSGAVLPVHTEPSTKLRTSTHPLGPTKTELPEEPLISCLANNNPRPRKAHRGSIIPRLQQRIASLRSLYCWP